MKQKIAILICISIFGGCNSPWDAQSGKINPTIDEFVIASDNYSANYENRFTISF